MAHCYICDKNMDEVRLDHRDMKPRPCTECETVINELVQAYEEDVAYNYIESELLDYDEELSRETDLGNS